MYQNKNHNNLHFYNHHIKEMYFKISKIDKFNDLIIYCTKRYNKYVKKVININNV